MDIDERLERLAERHQALLRELELTAAENRGLDRRWAQIREGIDRLLHVAEQRMARLQ